MDVIERKKKKENVFPFSLFFFSFFRQVWLSPLSFFGWQLTSPLKKILFTLPETGF
jgi:hypothetical protein